MVQSLFFEQILQKYSGFEKKNGPFSPFLVSFSKLDFQLQEENYAPTYEGEACV